MPSFSLDTLAAVPSGERDALAIVQAQNETRIQKLVPVRMGRMAQSAFAYYRGSAATMAHDLSTVPNSGIQVVACGDAHISNFGFYASPERRLLFDLNDFDEGGLAPWEWDLKRLVTSVYLAALDNGERRKDAWRAARKTAKSYRRWIGHLAEVSALDRFYATVDSSQLSSLFGDTGRKQLAKTERKARTRTSEHVLSTMTVTGESGRRRIVEQPPLTTRELVTDPATINRLWGEYVATTREDIRYLLLGYRLVDAVLRVVGVGSVGTRCYIVYLEDAKGNPLFLQLKEARETVLATHGGIEQVSASGAVMTNQGRRVVGAQRVLQAHSDPFLGWIEGYAQNQGEHVRVDYYWRQFKDMKGSINLARLPLEDLETTAKVCAGLLARAHAQTPAIVELAAKSPGGRDFDEALATFAQGYADVCLADYEQLRAAIASGQVPAEQGI